MTEEQQKEQFSIAYVRAIAAVAGVSVTRPEVDDDSIDIAFSSRNLQRPKLEAQLKCSAVLDNDGEVLRYPLNVKNYDDLRLDVIVPRVLNVLCVPERMSEWITLTPTELTLRKAAYWVSLKGQIETTNTSSVTVSIPKCQLFDVAALKRLLEQGVAR